MLIVEPESFGDERGFFLESYHRDKYRQAGIAMEFVQDNHSRSRKGVLRGIHYQDMTAPMAKLVRCTAGSILDLAVDLRVGSPTFAKWLLVELTEKNMHQLLVPVGFGHAFLTLSDSADVQYKCSTFYAPGSEGALLWNDPELGVRWPIAQPLVSQKDQAAVSLANYVKNPAFRYPLR